MGSNDFACYYQVYKDRDATIRVLEQFRQHHPDNQIFMVSDGGLEFYDIAEKYNCHYTHSLLNIGYWSHTKPEVIEYRATGGKRGHCYGWNWEEAVIYLSRFYHSAILDQNNNIRYMMLLADDVCVNRPIDVSQFNNADITYGGFNKFDFNTLLLKFNWEPVYNPGGWGMCCGNFINRKLFIEAYEKRIGDLICLYEPIYNSGLEGIGFMDTVMTVLLWLNKKDFSWIMNPLYSETNKEATIFHDRS